MSERADTAVYLAGLASSRSRAKEIILKKGVFYNGQVVEKPSQLIADPSLLCVNGDIIPYVSRGGLKLEKALDYFDIDVSSRVCVDIGASTGGFCDCLLKKGAAYVYAVDCGCDQLSESLKNNPAVYNMENTNARFLSSDDFDKEIDIVTCDASFISLTLLLPSMSDISRDIIVCLIKPQFEAGKNKLNKKGVVKDIKTHKTVINNIHTFAIGLGLGVKGITYSPVKGPEGNIEYLLYLKKNDSSILSDADINRCISEAFSKLE